MKNEWIVSKKQGGMRVIDFLLLHIETDSNKALKRHIESGSVRVNGKMERFASSKLKERDRVSFVIQEKKEIEPFDKQAILFEDESLLICNKPSGVACDPKGILAHLSRYSKQLKLVHRLDKDTSGVLILAKTESAKKKLEELFKERLVEKEYHAVVNGIVLFQKKQVVNRLGKIQEFSGQSLYGSGVKGGLEAITRFSLIKRGKYSSLLACYPETGRTHQIRVHLAELGFPILGDVLYGKEVGSRWSPGQLLLHAYRIKFSHPETNEIIEVEAPTPTLFHEALQR